MMNDEGGAKPPKSYPNATPRLHQSHLRAKEEGRM
jgi:hypothetical protein